MNCKHCGQDIYYATGGREHAWLHSDSHDARCGCYAEPEREGSRARRAGDTQPMPIHRDVSDIQSAVIEDIFQRREVGIQRYGTPLQPHNGRNALLDLYEELLDAVCYTKQALVERESVGGTGSA